jgi:hypothetical protein
MSSTSGPVTLALQLIEDQLHDVKKHTENEVKRLDKKLDTQTKVLSGILIANIVPALQSVGIHTTNWVPSVIKLFLGYVKI